MPGKTKNTTIGYRLLRTVFGCYFLVAVAVTSVQLVSEYANGKTNIFFELSHLSETLEDSLSRALWNYDSEQVEATLLGISKIEMVLGTRVTNNHNKPIATSGMVFDSKSELSSPKMEGNYGGGAINKYDYHGSEQYGTVFEYEVPIRYVDEREHVDNLIGYFYVYTDHAVVIDRVKSGFILIIVNSLIKTTALWLIFLFFTKRIISEPLGNLTKTARALDPSDPESFQEGEMVEKLPRSNHGDELQVLTDSLFKMRSAVLEKIDIIQEQNSSLERHVAERTANLTKANMKLAEEIEQRKQAEHSLRVYREIILHTDEAIIVTKPDGQITEANPACERTTGYSRDELIGSNSGFLGSGHQNSDVYQEMWASINKCGHWRGETCDTKKNGESMPLWIVVSALYDEQRRIEFLIIVYRDIGELKQAEARLSQAQKLESIGQLAAGVAHEMNTPTQFVGDNVRFLGNAFEDLRKVELAYDQLLEAARNGDLAANDIEYVDVARRDAERDYLNTEIPIAVDQAIDGVQRIAKIVGAMKSFSHMGSESKELADLNTAIDNTITVSANEWKYVANLETDLADDLPSVPCFLAELNQVVLNLIVNAAHAIADVVDISKGEKGQIEVKTRQVEQQVEVRISDTGCGIPEEVRDRIFDPFFTTKQVGKGTGQGLSIARNAIVELHDGTLEFDTEIGKGTTFIITLPLQ